jgi:murein DD-endopeptidase MepM/ murein hydrolase activator NlpD
VTTLQLPVHYYWWRKAERGEDGCALASHGVGEYQSDYEPHDSPHAWAIDLVVPEMVPLHAPAPGHIRASRRVGDKWTENSGHYTDIVIQTARGTLLVTYSHLADPPMYGEGMPVGEGDVVGFVGASGHSSGPHLHMEMMYWPSKERLCPYRVFIEGVENG